MAKKDIKSFETAVRENSGDSFSIKLDGRVIELTHPKSYSLQTLYDSLTTGNPFESTRGSMRFLDSCMNQEDSDWIASRLKDEEDDFDVINVAQIFSYVFEQVTGIPLGGEQD